MLPGQKRCCCTEYTAPRHGWQPGPQLFIPERPRARMPETSFPFRLLHRFAERGNHRRGRRRICQLLPEFIVHQPP